MPRFDRLFWPNGLIGIVTTAAVLGIIVFGIGCIVENNVLMTTGIWLAVPTLVVGAIAVTVIIPYLIYANWRARGRKR